MNDVGEKIPNWFESARLYYAYPGDSSVMTMVQKLVNYTLTHGTSPSGFAWSGFPYTTTNAGNTLFRGFTNSGRFARHEIQVDHSDNNVNSNTYKSNLSASNATLFLFDHPGFDPEWKTHIPMLIRWTEDNFVKRCAPCEPASMWGANIVGEQDGFLYKMDYQTARYAAACSRWYAISGDRSYKEKAYRSLNWVTYCNDTSGMAFESPVSKGILSW
jgi:hypothetical protein